MKNLLILTLIFLLFSCNSHKTNEVWVVEETSKIIGDYPDTLESSIKDAKKVKNQYNTNNDELEKQLQNARQ